MPHSKLNKAAQYQKVGVNSGLADASPHRLVQMLLDGAIEKMAKARGAMERGSISEKGEMISWAISIIGGLQGSLDMERGGEISANLSGLYDYMARRLAEANQANDPAVLDEVIGLISEIRDAWEAMPVEIKTTGAARLQASQSG